MAKTQRRAKNVVKPRTHKAKKSKQEFTKEQIAEARALELDLNAALLSPDYAKACQIADVYIEKYKRKLSYRHLVILAEVYLQTNQYKKSFDLLMDALKMDAKSEAAPEILFWVYHKMGNASRANEVLDQLKNEGPPERQKTYSEWEILRGNVEADQAKVLAAFEKAGALPEHDNPRFHELMFAYLMALSSENRADEAAKILYEIPEDLRYRTPNLPMIEGQIIKSGGDTPGAIEHYTRVLEKFNGLPEARWNRALCNLEMGRLESGWEDWYHRFDWDQFPSPRIQLDAPRWNGEDLTGKTLLLWAEQGLGDQLLFLSLALPLVVNPDIDVILAVHPKLVEFVRTWYPDARVETLNLIDSRGVAEYADADYQMPLGDLPIMFMRTDESLSSRPIRLMRSNPELRRLICSKEGWPDDSIIVGVCWRSSVVDASRSVHYVNVNMVDSLRNNLPEDVKFVNLQYALTQEETDTLTELGVHIPEPEFYNDILAHGLHVGICDYVVTPLSLTNQLAGLFDVNTITWTPAPGNWVFLGKRQYPWYRSIATIMLDHDHSRSSLVYQIGRWLNVAIGADTQARASC